MSVGSQPLKRGGGWRPRVYGVTVRGRPLGWYLSGWRIGIVALVLAVLFPFLFGSQALTIAGIQVGIFVLLALGLNVVVGFAGLLDLGYVAFYAIGAMTVGFLTGGLVDDINGTAHEIFRLNWFIVLPIAALLAFVFGILLGAPTLRLRGDYLAIVTLGFGEIVPNLFTQTPFDGEVNGLPVTGPPNIGPLRFASYLDRTWYYYLVLVLVVIVIFGVTSLRDSSLGRAWVAIREDETAAAASGVNLVRTKLLAFGIGALTGGIGGALYAGTVSNVAGTLFLFQTSILVLVMVVFGGIGSVPGVIVGASIIEFLNVYAIDTFDQKLHSWSIITDPSSPLHLINSWQLSQAKFAIFGAIMLIMILLRPQGLIPNRRRSRELVGEGAAPEDMSRVGRFEAAEEGLAEVDVEGEEITYYQGPGSDTQRRD